MSQKPVPGELLSYSDTGARGNVSDPVIVGADGWDQFSAVFAGENSVGENCIYAVTSDELPPLGIGKGQLVSYKDKGTKGNVGHPVTVGADGWDQFLELFAGKDLAGNGHIYALNKKSQLLSYSDDGTKGNVGHPVIVGSGGGLEFGPNFAGRNAAGQNCIYGVNQLGQLMYYLDNGNKVNVSDPVIVGSGRWWLEIQYSLFAGTNMAGQDRIYAVNPTGQLLSYSVDGTKGSEVIVGFDEWLSFNFLFAGKNLDRQNRIYAIVGSSGQDDGDGGDDGDDGEDDGGEA